MIPLEIKPTPTKLIHITGKQKKKAATITGGIVDGQPIALIKTSNREVTIEMGEEFNLIVTEEKEKDEDRKTIDVTPDDRSK